MTQIQSQNAKKQSSFIFWVLWTLLSILAWSIFMALNVLIGPAEQAKGLWFAGLIESVFQWVVLRSQVKHSHWWVISTTLFSFLIGLYILLGGNPITTLILFVIGIGLAQVLLLQHSIRRAWLWLVVRVLAFGLAALASILPVFIILLDSGGNPLYWGVEGLIAGAVYGAVSGAGMVILLRSPAVQSDSASSSRSIFSRNNLTIAVLVVVLLLAPFLAFGQIYSLQNNIFCNTLTPGMPRTEVNRQISNIRTFSENGMLFGTVQGGVPYPATMQSYKNEADSFYQITLEDWLVSVPPIGLAYDKAENLVFMTSGLRSYSLDYLPVNCPWGFQMTWDSLFK